MLLCKCATLCLDLFSVRSESVECTFTDGSYIVVLKYLCMYDWQLVCGKSDFLKVPLLFFFQNDPDFWWRFL